MGRAPCCEKNGLKKGPWTPEEDQVLIQYIQKHGHGSWRTLPNNAGLARCGKSCRLRWTNYLRPDIKRGRFSFEEEETIIQLHSILGNKWSAIAARLPGRTDNEIKNYWNTHIRKRLLRMGIDPVTHSPRLDLLDLSSVLGSSLCNPSHVNLSRLLGLQPFMNPELLRLATNILSSSAHRQNIPTPLPQSSTAVTESPCLSPSHMHASFPSFFDHQAPLQDHPPACTNSSNSPFYGSEAQVVLQQPSGDGFSSCPPDHETSQPNMWQCVNGASSYSGDHDFGCQSSFSNVYDVVQNGGMDPAVVPQSSKYFQINGMDEQNMSFPPPCLLTPQSSPTQLNSSTTYFNSSANTTPPNSSSTYNFNGGAEEDRESFCSSMLKFEMPPHVVLAACEF